MHHYALIAPCYNEGLLVERFLAELEGTLSKSSAQWTVIVVNDASTDDTLRRARGYAPQAGNVKVVVIDLVYNVGHQGAIYQGLLRASSTTASRFVVIDADGEDDPAAIAKMEAMHGAPIVFVSRGKRSEKLGFRIGYAGYKLLFRFITGRSITFGNYSMIDRQVLRAALDRSFVHYAAFLSHLRMPARLVTSDRRPRIDGSSKMNTSSLSMHAFRALIEYTDEVVLLFLKGFVLLTVFFLALILIIFGVKFFTTEAIPGWASTLSASLFNSMLICLGFLVTGLLLVSNAQRLERTRRRLFDEEPETPPSA